MNDVFFMRVALEEARKAADIGEVPVGAVIVKDGEIIARGHNLREKTQLSTTHAEMIAIDAACKRLGIWRLENCTMYVTIEPCPMCAGATIQSRIDRLVYGAKEPKNGVHVSKMNMFDVSFSHKVIISGGVLAEESEQLLKSFFMTLRNGKDSV